MAYKPPFEQTTEISNLCLEIAELVGMLHPNSELSTSPTLHRKLRIPSEVFGLFMLEIIHDALLPFAYPDGKANIRGQQALSFFAENPTGTVSELAEVLGCSKCSAERIVARPRKDCLPEREDGTRGDRWIV